MNRLLKVLLFPMIFLAASLPIAAQPLGPSTITLNFAAVPVVAFMQATYKNLLMRDYVISPEVLALDRQFSINIKSLPVEEVPAFVDGLLRAQGIRTRIKDGVYYLEMAPASADKAVPELPQAALASASAAGSPPERDGAAFDVVELYVPRHRPAEFLVTAINAAFGAPYARLAGVVVALSAPAARSADARRLLEALDERGRTVEVSASFVEVLRSDSSSRGLSLVASTLAARFGAAFSTSTGSLSVSAGGFQLVLDALRADGRFKQVSNSRVLGDEAEHLLLTVGDETPTVASTGRDNQGNAVQNIVYRPSGVILDVTPRAAGPGRLSLAVDGQVSSFQSTVNGVTGSPTLLKRQVKTSVTIADGEVVIIGGLDDTRSSTTHSGLSFLPRSWGGGTSSDSHTDLVLILSARVASALN
ncbi:bacterial type II and III secretion system protein [Janthinobacterium sp. HH107]|uniref:type II secretion system protein GspD n=1 Tax=Janthinobacterium sp. HH107 TaxID=1537279 RepID=UPI000892FF23|nr:hypothetical protein [Janthinobacterium sp. HH107]OFA05226.1 bacterial type II and III secretion system protein [Janthinobacterium sp. HH107]